MSFRFFGPTFDGIFVAGGSSEASVAVELAVMRDRYFKYPVRLAQPESGDILWRFDDSVETHRQPNLNGDVRKQSVLVTRQGRGFRNHIYGRSQEAL
jgi:hypothetical protein